MDAKLALNSNILLEQFYFFTVVIMWLIHAGFMAYEAGASRRKNLMSTAMKNILTIAVVTPTFYYAGWYIYGCFEPGFPTVGPDSLDGHAGPEQFPGFCGQTAPWANEMGPDLANHLNAVFFLAFLLFSWTTASIMSGALIERVRLSAYLILGSILGSFVWIMDAAWGWSSGGWLTVQFGFHDSIASLVVHGVAGAFTLGVLLNLGPRIGKYTTDGLARSFRGHNTHLTLMGLMLIFTGFYGFYAACLFITPTTFPGWLNIYGSPTTLGAIAFVITVGFAGGFTGGWFASKGDPFWTLSGGLAGRDLGFRRRRRVSPVARLPPVHQRRDVGGLGGRRHRKEVPDRRCSRGRCGARRLRVLRRVFLVGIFAGGYPTGLNNVESSMGGQLMGMMAFLPLAFIPGYVVSWLLKRFNLLRVPPEVELEGLDLAEFGQDFYPEFERVPEVIIEPDGREVDGAPILLDAYWQTNGKPAERVGAGTEERG